MSEQYERYKPNHKIMAKRHENEEKVMEAMIKRESLSMIDHLVEHRRKMK